MASDTNALDESQGGVSGEPPECETRPASEAKQRDSHETPISTAERQQSALPTGLGFDALGIGCAHALSGEAFLDDAGSDNPVGGGERGQPICSAATAAVSDSGENGDVGGAIEHEVE